MYGIVQEENHYLQRDHFLSDRPNKYFSLNIWTQIGRH